MTLRPTLDPAPANGTPAGHTANGTHPLGDYRAAVERGGVPTLGDLVLYTIAQTSVTHQALRGWLTELRLDATLAGSPPRALDAFVKAVGEVKHTYPLDAGGHGADRAATILIRQVHRDTDEVVCRIVREVRDGAARRLEYDPHVGEAAFRADRTGTEAGAGALSLRPNLAVLDGADAAQVCAVLDGVRERYQHHRDYLGADRLRAVVRSHLERLHSVKVKPSGGVYFVHRHHRPTLHALDRLVGRFGAGSLLVCSPLVDTDAMREWVIANWRERAAADLERLAGDIAEAHQAPGRLRASTADSLHNRYRDLKAAADEHTQLLRSDQQDLHGRLGLVNEQLSALLARL